MCGNEQKSEDKCTVLLCIFFFFTEGVLAFWVHVSCVLCWKIRVQLKREKGGGRFRSCPWLRGNCEFKEPELCATFYYGRDGERERRMSCAGLITKMNQNDQNIFKYSKSTRERESSQLLSRKTQFQLLQLGSIHYSLIFTALSLKTVWAKKKDGLRKKNRFSYRHVRTLNISKVTFADS